MSSPSADQQRDRDLRRPGVWRQEVLARSLRIDNMQVQDAEAARVSLELTEIARQAAHEPGGPRRWWNGTLIERAWLALHDAETEALAGMPLMEAIHSWWSAAGTWRRGNSLEDQAVLPKDARTAVAWLRVSYDRSDRLFEETRALRNRLICLTFTGVIITGLLLTVGSLGVLSVNSGSRTAVSGAWQFLLVALFGVIGAFISGLPALSRLPRRLSSYWTAPYQMSLKLAVGPVFALLGVMALDVGFVDQARPFIRFGGAVLLWAVVFGSAQQLLTRILDRKASTLAAASADSADPRHAPNGADHPTGKRA
jgi:hypothetical protein